MIVRQRLLLELADGRFHSGQQLASAMGITRSAVWKQIQRLTDDWGIHVDAVRGRGYRFSAPLELLDAELINAEFSAASRNVLQVMTLQQVTTSTNADASKQLPVSIGQATVVLAEHQTAGRGRRGRPWVSSFGRNLYLSLAWRFDLAMTELSGLSLVTGVVLAEALEGEGLSGHTLKWPNDILADGRKLCGILVEASGEAGGPSNAVIGIGVNCSVPDLSARQIDQPWTDLERLGLAPVCRNRLAGRLISRLIEACSLYSREGLRPFLQRWKIYDSFTGQTVRILQGDRVVEGIYRGIADNGAVVVETSGGLAQYHAGEISMRGILAT